MYTTYMPHIVFLSNDTAYISLLTKLTIPSTCRWNTQFLLQTPQKPEYSKPIYVREEWNWIFILSGHQPADQKLFDLQKPFLGRWVSVYFHGFCCFKSNQPTRFYWVLLSHLCKAFHALHIKFQFYKSNSLFDLKFYLLSFWQRY